MDLFGKLKETVQSVTEKAASIAKNAADTVSDAAKSATGAVADFAKDTAESVSDVVKKAPGAVADFAKDAAESVKGFILPRKIDPLTGQKESEPTIILSTIDALKLFYYMLCADEKILASEEEKFDEIAKQIDPRETVKKEDIIRDCRVQLDKAGSSDEYNDILLAGVDYVLNALKPVEEGFVTPKILIWNLLSIAFSDQNYDETEKHLIQHIAEKLNVDQAVFLELVSSMMALVDIEKELDWIKTTNKPYLTIEAMINELKDRKDVIFESVEDLIAL